MKTYYAENELNVGCCYGGGELDIPYTSIEEAKAHYIDFFKEEVMYIFDELGEDIEDFYDKAYHKLTEKGKEKVWQYIEEHCHPHFVCKELPDYDYYSVQSWCDGFGNDTYTVTAFPNVEQAIAYNEKHDNKYIVVGQWWGEEYQTYY